MTIWFMNVIESNKHRVKRVFNSKRLLMWNNKRIVEALYVFEPLVCFYVYMVYEERV